MDIRQISLKILLRNDAEKALVYATFRLREDGVFRYDERKIVCRVDSISILPYARPLMAEVMLLCPDPFFEALVAARVEIHGTVNCFKFPMALPSSATYKFAGVDGGRIGTFVNNGVIPCGCIFTITAKANCSCPKLQDAESYNWIKLDINLVAGDKIIIDTRAGYKSITLDSGGVREDIINTLVWGSTFLQIALGTSRIAVSADSGQDNLTVRAEFVPLYGGI